MLELTLSSMLKWLRLISLLTYNLVLVIQCLTSRIFKIDVINRIGESITTQELIVKVEITLIENSNYMKLYWDHFTFKKGLTFLDPINI